MPKKILPISSSPQNQTIPRNQYPTKTLNNVNDHLIDLHKQLQIDLLKQLLKLKNLSMDWFDIIIDLAWKCIDLVKPDVKHDNDLMDIRNHIKIKKFFYISIYFFSG
jgi:1-phosphatidylinositol-3-phosphate 5-kinase